MTWKKREARPEGKRQNKNQSNPKGIAQIKKTLIIKARITCIINHKTISIVKFLFE